jgi:hypothetical protein
MPRRRAGGLLILALLGPSGVARAQQSDAEAAYAQHTASAARLLDEEDFVAAQAEFEAAYRARPKARALLDAGRCEKARFRYPQAIALIERALAARPDPLDDPSRRAAEEALAELRAQLGSVQITLAPAHATLRIDGEDQPPGAAARAIPLGPGSHRLEARLAGHVPAGLTITLAGGDQVAVKLRLLSETDPAAEPPTRRGLYVLGALTGFVPVGPTDFSGTAAGISGGARVGYRLAGIVGAELGFEYAHAGASGRGKPSFVDGSATYPIGYSLSSFRFGVNVRLMTTGERIRFVQTFGGGAMRDSISWQPTGGGPAIARQGLSGMDAFAMSETGFEVDLAGGLVGLTAQQFLGSSGALDAAKHDKFAANTYGGPQFALGLGLRGGYRLW